MRNEILASLSDRCRAYLETRLLTKPVISGEVLYVHNSPLQNVIFPHDGLISLQASVTNGRSIGVMATGCEGMIGFETFLGLDRSPYGAVVVVSGSASWLPTGEFVELEREFPCVAPAMRGYMAGVIKRFAQVVVCTSIHTAAQRIASWLLTADQRVAGRVMDLTQRDLADILGVRLATASEACHKLMEAGAIRYTRGSLSVVDRDRLVAHACACS